MDFVKYQGTGNDFIIIDGRNSAPDVDVAALCHRRFGIGADGFMILKNHVNYDFEMVYFNSDGNLSSMCGNGGRCIAHFASSLGLGESLNFLAVDGPHKALVNDLNVELEMTDVLSLKEINPETFEIHTGSPHYVHFNNIPIAKQDLLTYARGVRYSPLYKQQGINVNIVNAIDGQLHVRTYERGVEDETYSCGTGVTACALSYMYQHKLEGEQHLKIHTPGGMLEVKAISNQGKFTRIRLIGPATLVFRGRI